MRKNINYCGKWNIKTAVFVLFFAGLCPLILQAEGLRNISVVSFDYYFDNTFRLSIEDVFLARIAPRFTLQFKLARYETDTRYQHVLSLGPVISFTENLYMDAMYGLGLDSALVTEHRGDLNLNFETDDTLLQMGIRGGYTPESGYFYLIPSVGGKFLLAEWLGFMNKIFLSWDNMNVFSGSYWGELEWNINTNFTIRTGGTVGWTEEISYSILAGVSIRFSPDVFLKYHFKYLANNPDYSGGTPVKKEGIENGVFLDIRF